MPTYHRDDVEPSAIHPAAFVGAVDPAGTPANNVGPHKLWIDTTGSTFKIKKRDVGNTTWEIVASLTHADLTGLTAGDPHTQYLAKALGTTKGDILVYDGSAWVRLPAGTDGYLLTADSGATEGVGWQSSAVISGAHVIQDVGVDMDQEGQLNFVGFLLTDTPGTPGTTTVTNPSVINPMTTPGDLIVGGAAGAPTRMAKGADDDYLRIDPTTHLLEWGPLPAGGGSVTSVALTMPAEFSVTGSPVTGAGTIVVTEANQSANTVYAGPASGGAAAPNYRALVAADLPINAKRISIAFQFGDGTNAIVAATEREQWLECNFDGTIEGYSLTADAVGSLVIDLWKDTYANYPPVVADTITASDKPTLSATQKQQNTTLTGWTTAITRGQTIKAHVDSAGTVKAATLTLYVVKT
jgi:hypothetical protein